ncbi:MAG: hypothetical protein JXA04_06725, partial [Gammaproteobacteria bacterium]|nr:hypothetical protein [Gammaproteobacteria bacterium]
LIRGSQGDDVIMGLSGQDYLFGEAGDDIFLISGSEDEYDEFDGGTGIDTILGSTGDDTIRVNTFGPDNSVENIDGNGGYDVIGGTEWADSIDLSATTVTGISAIDGGADNDTIIGSVGDDFLVGNAGNDYLYGGSGSDTYLFGIGDERDYIIEDSTDLTGVDQVLFGNGIDSNDLWFSQVDDDLEVSIIGTDDRVIVNDWFSHANTIEQFETSNGDVLMADQVQQLVNAMAIFNPPDEGIVNPTQEDLDSVAAMIAVSWG